MVMPGPNGKRKKVQCSLFKIENQRKNLALKKESQKGKSWLKKIPDWMVGDQSKEVWFFFSCSLAQLAIHGWTLLLRTAGLGCTHAFLAGRKPLFGSQCVPMHNCLQESFPCLSSLAEKVDVPSAAANLDERWCVVPACVTIAPGNPQERFCWCERCFGGEVGCTTVATKNDSVGRVKRLVKDCCGKELVASEKPLHARSCNRASVRWPVSIFITDQHQMAWDISGALWQRKVVHHSRDG